MQNNKLSGTIPPALLNKGLILKWVSILHPHFVCLDNLHLHIMWGNCFCASDNFDNLLGHFSIRSTTIILQWYVFTTNWEQHIHFWSHLHMNGINLFLPCYYFSFLLVELLFKFFRSANYLRQEMVLLIKWLCMKCHDISWVMTCLVPRKFKSLYSISWPKLAKIHKACSRLQIIEPSFILMHINEMILIFISLYNILIMAVQWCILDLDLAQVMLSWYLSVSLFIWTFSFFGPPFSQHNRSSHL